MDNFAFSILDNLLSQDDDSLNQFEGLAASSTGGVLPISFDAVRPAPSACGKDSMFWGGGIPALTSSAAAAGMECDGLPLASSQLLSAGGGSGAPPLSRLLSNDLHAPIMPLGSAISATTVVSASPPPGRAKGGKGEGAKFSKRKAPRKVGGGRGKAQQKRPRSATEGSISATGDADDEGKVEKLGTEAKKHRRLVRNRMSAQLHRERKKAYLEGLQNKVEALTQENSRLNALAGGLQNRVGDLERENAQLRASGGKRQQQRLHSGSTCSTSSAFDGSSGSGGEGRDATEIDSDASDGTAPDAGAKLLPAPAVVATPVARSPEPPTSASGNGSGSASGAAARMAMVPTALLACVLCFNVMSGTTVPLPAGVVRTQHAQMMAADSLPLAASLARAVAPHRAGHGRVLLSTLAARTVGSIAAPADTLSASPPAAAPGAAAEGLGRALAFRERATAALKLVVDDSNSRAMSVFEQSKEMVVGSTVKAVDPSAFVLPTAAARALQTRAEAEKVALYGVDGAENSGASPTHAESSFVMCPHAHSAFADPALQQLNTSQLFGPRHGYTNRGSGAAGSRAVDVLKQEGGLRRGEVEAGRRGEWSSVATNGTDAPFLLLVVPSSSVARPPSAKKQQRASGYGGGGVLDSIEGFNGKEEESDAEWVEIGCQMLMARPFWPTKKQSTHATTTAM